MNRTVYRVQKQNETLFIGPLGQCWIYLRDTLGNIPLVQVREMGWQINPARSR